MFLDSVDYAKGETPMTDMQTKVMLAAIADILVTSQSLGEAYERFKRVTNSAGIPFEELKGAQTAEDTVADLTRERTLLREENATLRADIERLKDPSQ